MSVGRGPRALRIPRRVLLWRGRVVLSASVTLRGHRCPAAAVMASPHPGPGSGRAGPSPLCMPQGRRRFPVSPSPEPATRGAGRVWFSRSPRGFWAASWCQASKSLIGALCGAADVRDGPRPLLRTQMRAVCEHLTSSRGRIFTFCQWSSSLSCFATSSYFWYLLFYILLQSTVLLTLVNVFV